LIVRAAALAGVLLCAACAGATGPADPGAGADLKPCPRTRNCVSSRASDAAHRVDPLPLRGAGAEGLAALRQVLLAMPRSRIVAEGNGYLRAEFRSRIFRFVDDVDFLVDEAAGVIHVRSASRVGAGDLGVNRRRVEEIRARFTRPEPAAAGATR
jgi:uncharacterized protein (DUF1499 family)